MDRKGSVSRLTAQTSYPPSSTLPPWELPSLPQVPYLDRSSAPLSDAERRALPSLWATRVKAMPGTMSSRTSRKRSDGRNRTRSISKERRRRKAVPELETAPLASRMKTAFKDMFKKDPIDESRFERIESRHWTDD
ncbi:hypothetical protein LTR28_004636 [Elasticomyces elasticus]|nr:hypothetical protein LTR28_004636 [Elasticomyces elasticus]